MGERGTVSVGACPAQRERAAGRAVAECLPDERGAIVGGQVWKDFGRLPDIAKLCGRRSRSTVNVVGMAVSPNLVGRLACRAVVLRADA